MKNERIQVLKELHKQLEDSYKKFGKVANIFETKDRIVASELDILKDDVERALDNED